ncbi:MAG: response regulator transcription factor [Clostridia bacterium]|nr:response regulator transcription factor [Clostridia bacterium]MBR0413451.1 response regulator transcription factor [Clostridia bacterium]
MKICICEDIAAQAQQLRALIDEYFAAKACDVQVSVFESAEALLAGDAAKENAIFFVDIELGALSGLELIRAISEQNRAALFIVVTAYHRYLDDAMDLNVLRYLDKPVEKERLFSALDKALQEFGQGTVEIKGKNNRTYRIKKADIIYAESKFKKTFVCTVDNTIETKLPLKEIKEMLASPDFIVPHASFVLNKNYIVRFERTAIAVRENMKTVSIPVSPKRQAEVRKQVLFEARGGDC